MVMDEETGLLEVEVTYPKALLRNAPNPGNGSPEIDGKTQELKSGLGMFTTGIFLTTLSRTQALATRFIDSHEFSPVRGLS